MAAVDQGDTLRIPGPLVDVVHAHPVDQHVVGLEEEVREIDETGVWRVKYAGSDLLGARQGVDPRSAEAISRARSGFIGSPFVND